MVGKRTAPDAAKNIPVTESSGNVFADLGLTEPEEELTKAQLASHIRLHSEAPPPHPGRRRQADGARPAQGLRPPERPPRQLLLGAPDAPADGAGARCGDRGEPDPHSATTREFAWSKPPRIRTRPASPRRRTASRWRPRGADTRRPTGTPSMRSRTAATNDAGETWTASPGQNFAMSQNSRVNRRISAQRRGSFILPRPAHATMTAPPVATGRGCIRPSHVRAAGAWKVGPERRPEIQEAREAR